MAAVEITGLRNNISPEREDRDVVAMRWYTKEPGVPWPRQKDEIEKMVNGWLETHKDRHVKSIVVKYAYDFLEGNREFLTPRFIVYIHSEKGPEVRHKRGFTVHREQFPGDLPAAEEDRAVEAALNKLAEKHPERRIKHVTYQNDFAKVLDGGITGTRVVVGMYWEEDRRESRPKGSFHVLRRYSLGKPVGEEDKSYSDLVAEWQKTEPCEKIVAHANRYAWVANQTTKGLEPRSIFLLYSETQPKPVDCGVAVMRYLGALTGTGADEDKESTQVINDWIRSNPDKRPVSITFQYEWGAVHPGGRQAARITFTINWERVEPDEIYFYPTAIVKRRIGRLPDEKWSLEEEEESLQDFIRDAKGIHPEERLANFNVEQGLANYYPQGQNAFRHIAFMLFERDPLEFGLLSFGRHKRR